MNNQPLFFTDLFDQERDQKYSRQLTEMVSVTQIVGLVLIAVGIFTLAHLPSFQRTLSFWLLGVGFCSTVAFFFYCWFDLITDVLDYIEFIEWRPLALSEAQRKTRVLRGIFLLMVIDTLILTALIAITGGPGNSTLDPLLPIIPIIAMILQQPKRTVYVALFSGLIVILNYLVHHAVHTAGLSHPHLGNGWVYDAHHDSTFPYAFGMVSFGAACLTIFEFRISHKMPSLRKGVKAIAGPLLEGNPNSNGIIVSVRKGVKSWVKWLEHRDLPTGDLSLVHDEQELIKQAVVLSLPHWIARSDWGEGKLRRITRRITFLTLAAHWIDDHFDSLAVYCENPSIRGNILQSHPPALLNKFHRLKELVNGMKRIAHNKHQAQIEKAVVRIIYGGLIQNAATDERLQLLLREYVEFVSKGLPAELQDIYERALHSERPATVWITTKVVMELLDCCSPDFLAKEAEFLNLLYGPILYYQDGSNEILKESFGSAFGSSITEIEGRLPRCGDFISLLDQCRAIMPTIYGQGGLPFHRQEQLGLLLKIYRNTLPADLTAGYKNFLATEMRNV